MSTVTDPDNLEELTLFHEVLPTAMVSKRHSILVRRYAFRQFRIQLTRVDQPDNYAREGHGTICRELCTYSPLNLAWAVAEMSIADDPEAWCRAQETRQNCEQPRTGRIRLDNTPREA